MPDDDKPNPARELGRKRMAKLTPEQRSELGKRAALARWPKPPQSDIPVIPSMPRSKKGR